VLSSLNVGQQLVHSLLDSAAGLSASSKTAAMQAIYDEQQRVQAAAEEKARLEAEEKARLDAEAAEKARLEAEAAAAAAGGEGEAAPAE
jgi:hypothetical protein